MFALPDWILGTILLMSMTLALVGWLGMLSRVLIRLNTSHLRETPRFLLISGVATYAVALYATAAAAAWALIYVSVGAIDTWRNAILYSLEAITCYGHANVFLTPEWQILGAIEAVNGLILFGLSTAFLFTVMQQIWPEGLK